MPHDDCRFTLEASPTATTLYLHGTLTVRAVVHALRACDALPPRVQALRVDLRSATANGRTLDALAVLVAEWRLGRAALPARCGDIPRRAGALRAAHAG